MPRLSLCCIFALLSSSFAFTDTSSTTPTLETTPATREWEPETVEMTPSFDPDSLPWFTGPLLAPSAHAVPLGYINIEPYAFYTIYDGSFDTSWNYIPYDHNFYSATFQIPLWLGLTPWMDIQITGASFWSETQGVSSLVFGDLSVQFDFQVIKDTKDNKLPGLKLYVTETFPTGPYQELNPIKLFTDSGGAGSYQTTLGFVIARTFHIYKEQYIALRFNGSYTYLTNVHVKGLNTYGGGPLTNGTVHIGKNNWGGILAFEYSFNRNWAFACDFYGSYSAETTFTGVSGLALDGTPAKVSGPYSIQFSVAPAIEYNFSDRLGIIAGGWVTCTGRSTSRQINAVLAINYYGPLPKSTSRL